MAKPVLALEPAIVQQVHTWSAIQHANVILIMRGTRQPQVAQHANVSNYRHEKA